MGDEPVDRRQPTPPQLEVASSTVVNSATPPTPPTQIPEKLPPGKLTPENSTPGKSVSFSTEVEQVSASESRPGVVAAFPSELIPGVPDTQGRYQIIRRIGEGGMGVVFEAFQPATNLRVALKTLLPRGGIHLSRFFGEFRALAELRHENLVCIHEFVSTGNIPYYTMELVDGTSFVDWVFRVEAEHRDERLRAGLRQFIEALDFVHQKGWLHRDIKPSNVLVDHSGRVVLLDFGLATDMDQGIHRSSTPGVAVGTLVYMPPEQQEGRELSPAADWYSVGVLLHECLTREFPFDAMDVQGLLAQKKFGPKMNRIRDRLKPCFSDDLARLCFALLAPDPQDRPTSEEIRCMLGSTSLPQAATRARSFLGREPQIAALQEELEKVRVEQRARLVLVYGESGMGKSDVVNHFLDQVAQAGHAQVYRGRCYENVLVPYRAFEAVNAGFCRRLQEFSRSELDAIIPLEAPALCAIFPVFREVFPSVTSPPRSLPPLELRSSAFEAFREMIGRLGPLTKRPPVVLFIDDLQWGDQDSVSLLDELLRSPSRLSCLVMVAFRREDAGRSPCLKALFGQDVALGALGALEPRGLGSKVPFRLMEVGPLPRVAAVEMARFQLAARGLGDSLAEFVAAESHGSPLFIAELVQHIQKSNGGEGISEGLSLESMIWQMVEQLSEGRRKLMEFVAIAGRPLPRQDAYAALGLDQLDPALIAGLIHDCRLRIVGSQEQGALDTYHDRIRETILGKLSAGQRLERHQQLAKVLEGRGGHDPEFLAQQFDAAGEPAKAARYFLSAADQANEALAFDRAASLYTKVLELTHPSAKDAVPIWVKLADALANSGRCADAAARYLQAAGAAEPEARLTLWQAAALRYLTSGYVEEGVQVLRQALRQVGMHWPPTRAHTIVSLLWWRMRLAMRGLEARTEARPPVRNVRQRLEVCWSAVAGLSLVDPMRGAAFDAQNVWLALQANDPLMLLRALTAHTALVAIGGQPAIRSVERLLNRAETIATKVQGAYALGNFELAKGTAAHLQGRWVDAWESCDKAAQLMLDSGNPDIAWELATARTFSCWARMYAGDYAELAKLQPKWYHEAAKCRDIFARVNFGSTVMLAVTLAADQPDEAARQLHEDANLLVQNAFHVQHHNTMHARAILAMYCDRGREAWEIVAQNSCRYKVSLLWQIEQVRIDHLQVRGRVALAACATATDRELRVYLREIAQIARRLKRETAPWARAYGALFRAGLAWHERGAAACVPLLETAIGELDRAQMRLVAAAARSRLAELVDGQRRPCLRQEAEQFMAQQGIRNPARMTHALVPGFVTRKG